MRPDIDIVIPAQHESAELDAVVAAISKHTQGYRLRVMFDPSINVSECRQTAMDASPGRFICFMDSDAHQLQDGWLDELHRVVLAAPDAVVVYAGEQWGDDPAPLMRDPVPDAPWQRVDFGPAACMLIDRDRLSREIRWCAPLGLSNGWLGGDFEEVEYARQISRAGGCLYRATRTLFHHRGGRTSKATFNRTDRCQVIGVIKCLLHYQQASNTPGFWNKLNRVPCSSDDDLSFHPSVVSPLRRIFRDVVIANNLSRVPSMTRLGILP